MFDPGDDNGGLLARLHLVNLKHVDRHALREFLCGYGALRGRKRSMPRARKLVGTHALSRVRLDNQTIASASGGGEIVGGHFGAHALY
jgi:hypothetical protein